MSTPNDSDVEAEAPRLVSEPMPERLVERARIFRAMFVPVPLTPEEERDDPDYGL